MHAPWRAFFSKCFALSRENAKKTGHQLSEMLPDGATKVSERDVVQAFRAIGVHDMFRAQGPRRG